jgi:hypothetical protein
MDVYSKPAHAHDFAVMDEDITIAIPEQEAGESIDAGPTAVNDSLEERDDSLSEEGLESDSSAGPTTVTSTRSGSMINRPTRLIKEAGAAMPDLKNLGEYEFTLTRAEEHYYKAMKILQEGEFIPNEVNCVRAGISGGFANTKELHAMKYQRAMKTKDVKHWEGESCG